MVASQPAQLPVVAGASRPRKPAVERRRKLALVMTCLPWLELAVLLVEVSLSVMLEYQLLKASDWASSQRQGLKGPSEVDSCP